MSELPVLDIAPFLADPRSAAGLAFSDELGRVSHEIGFAHIVGHGIEADLERQLLRESRRFLELPIEERNAIPLANSAAFRGYTSLGDERTRGQSDWRDQLDFGPEQEAPDPNVAGPPFLRLRGPNQWPDSVPELAPTALRWLDSMLDFGLGVLRALALSLGQPVDHFTPAFVPQHDLHAKIIRYPAGPAGSDQGVGLHHDSGVLTFILQSEVPGLEVQLGDDMVLVEPMPGAYVTNLGAMMQTATSGYLRATPHRVVRPTGRDDRISVALFFNPAFESTFEPLELPPDIQAKARPDLVDLKGEPIHTLFGENNLKVRLRSHPDVAARHYADVLAKGTAT